MGQPKSQGGGPQLFHVNFHTVRNKPVFDVPEYFTLLEQELAETLQHWRLICLAHQIMPTHVHFILVAFSDLSLGRIVNLIKGRTARLVMAAAPELRADLGDHLWQEGYNWVEITSHQQCANAIRYVRENRRKAGLADKPEPFPNQSPSKGL